MRRDELGIRAAGLRHVIYDGVDLADWFEVTALDAPAFAPVTPVTSEVPGKAGVHYHSARTGSIEITLRLMARADRDDPADVLEMWRTLKPLLLKDEPKPLHLDSERYYLAMVTGDFPLEFIGARGAVDVTFTCFDPRLYGAEHVVELEAGTNRLLVLSGDDTWPTIRIRDARGPLTVKDEDTARMVVVPGAGEAEVTIDMEGCKVSSGLGYLPVDVSLTDFFPLRAGSEAHINVSAGSGTLTYREVY